MKFPALEDIRQLPVQLDMVVPRDWEDRNGHVNVQFYLRAYEFGAWAVLEDEGFDEAWFSANDLSMFDLEHHLHYRAEMHVGDRITAYNRIVGKSDKRFHGLYLVVNETRQLLAATVEYVTACIDMSSRRMAPMPHDLDRSVKEIFARHAKLEWAPPLCGTIKA